MHTHNFQIKKYLIFLLNRILVINITARQRFLAFVLAFTSVCAKYKKLQYSNREKCYKQCNKKRLAVATMMMLFYPAFYIHHNNSCSPLMLSIMAWRYGLMASVVVSKQNNNANSAVLLSFHSILGKIYRCDSTTIKHFSELHETHRFETNAALFWFCLQKPPTLKFFGRFIAII